MGEFIGSQQQLHIPIFVLKLRKNSLQPSMQWTWPSSLHTDPVRLSVNDGITPAHQHVHVTTPWVLSSHCYVIALVHMGRTVPNDVPISLNLTMMTHKHMDTHTLSVRQTQWEHYQEIIQPVITTWHKQWPHSGFRKWCEHKKLRYEDSTFFFFFF